MKKIKLTQGKYTQIDDKDFDRVSQFKWQFGAKGYATRLESRRINGKRARIFLARFIMDCPKGKVVDHINGNKLDNHRGNLRICTQSDNRKNSKKISGSYSKYKGITKQEKASKINPWIARIYDNGKRISLGRFADEKQAAQAYNRKASELFGEYALLNTI